MGRGNTVLVQSQFQGEEDGRRELQDHKQCHRAIKEAGQPGRKLSTGSVGLSW